MGGILTAAPLDLIDLLLDLQGFEVVEFGLVGLELGVEFIFACFFLRDDHICQHSPWSFFISTIFKDVDGRPSAAFFYNRGTDSLVPLEQDDSASLIAGC